MADDSRSTELHTLASHTEAAVGALGSAYAAHELVNALDDDKHEAGDHYLRAAVGAAVAVGAFYQLSKKADHPLWREDSSISSDDEEAQQTELVKSDQTEIMHHKHHKHHKHHRSDGSHHHEHPHHIHPSNRRLLLEEAVGAYSLGKELLGDKRHHIIHLIGEALGAVGTIKDIHDQRP